MESRVFSLLLLRTGGNTKSAMELSEGCNGTEDFLDAKEK